MSGDHTDIWDYIQGHGHELAELLDRFIALEKRVNALEADTPPARRLQYEADVAMADAAEYDRHGRDCDCGYCHDPGGDR